MKSRLHKDIDKKLYMGDEAFSNSFHNAPIYILPGDYFSLARGFGVLGPILWNVDKNDDKNDEN